MTHKKRPYHQRVHRVGLEAFGLSYSRPPAPLPYKPAGLLSNPSGPTAPNRDNSSSSRAPGSCGSKIPRDPGVRNGEDVPAPTPAASPSRADGVRNGESRVLHAVEKRSRLGVMGGNTPALTPATARFRNGVRTSSAFEPSGGSPSGVPIRNPSQSARRKVTTGGGSRCDL